MVEGHWTLIVNCDVGGCRRTIEVDIKAKRNELGSFAILFEALDGHLEEWETAPKGETIWFICPDCHD
ncbi:MAG: hypothetical protein ABEN55_04105 [Bradymonadaceae bacterium]